MRHQDLLTTSGFTGIIRDPLGGIDVRFYEKRAREERDREIDSLAKWIVGRFTRPRRPAREG
jgi:hypothetical protein